MAAKIWYAGIAAALKGQRRAKSKRLGQGSNALALSHEKPDAAGWRAAADDLFNGAGYDGGKHGDANDCRQPGRVVAV